MFIIWAIVVLCAAVGGFELLNTLTKATSAPQQAAGAGLAVAIAVIPYIVARAIEGMMAIGRHREVLDALSRLTSDNNYKAGIDSLFKQLEAIRANTAPRAGIVDLSSAETPAPAPSVTPVLTLSAGMGRCPGCRRLRGAGAIKCVYCGSTDPVVE